MGRAKVNGRAGFTLVEILVVIAIIGILAAILLPTLAKAKMRAMTVQCVSNIKQMGVGYISFAVDNRRPLRYHAESENTAWLKYLQAYEGLDDRTLNCPACNPNGTGRVGDLCTAWNASNPSAALTRDGGGPGDDGDWRTVELGRFALDQVPGLAVGPNGNREWELLGWQTRRRSIMWYPKGWPDGEAKAVSFGWMRLKKGIGLPFAHESNRPNGTPYPRRKNYILRTQVVSKVRRTVEMGIDGDDGHSMYINGKFVAGGPVFQRAMTRYTFEPGKKTTIELFVHDSGGRVQVVLQVAGSSKLPREQAQPGSLAAAGSSCYSINVWAQSFHPNEKGAHAGKFYTILSMGSSDTPIFAEGVWAGTMPRAGDSAPPNLNGQEGGMGSVCMARHGHAINVAFMDGSVRTVKLGELWSLKWHRRWQAGPGPVLPSQ